MKFGGSSDSIEVMTAGQPTVGSSCKAAWDSKVLKSGNDDSKFRRTFQDCRSVEEWKLQDVAHEGPLVGKAEVFRAFCVGQEVVSELCSSPSVDTPNFATTTPGLVVKSAACVRYGEILRSYSMTDEQTYSALEKLADNSQEEELNRLLRDMASSYRQHSEFIDGAPIARYCSAS
jgi:hypothetical protein